MVKGTAVIDALNGYWSLAQSIGLVRSDAEASLLVRPGNRREGEPYSATVAYSGGREERLPGINFEGCYSPREALDVVRAAAYALNDVRLGHPDVVALDLGDCNEISAQSLRALRDYAGGRGAEPLRRILFSLVTEIEERRN